MKKVEINRNNYETWFVDYLDGNLDEKLVDSFIEFLQKNPDLKAELKLFESVSAVPENLTFSGKSKLYKTKYDHEAEFNEAAIAEIEGDLDEEETAVFEKYLAAHPEKQKDKQLFEKTILHADENIRFAHKNRLYKKSGRKIALLWAGRVAAVLILALAIFSLFDPNDKIPAPQNQLARVEKKTETPKEIVEKPVVPVQTETKKVVEKPKPEDIKKKTEIKKEIKSLREETKGRTIQDDLALERIPLEVPKTLSTLTASIDVQAPRAELGVMTLVYADLEIDDERLLTDNLRGKVSLQKITRAGLNLVTSLSNERFTYETDEEGKVTEYNYDSRLLAFSIPSSHPADEE